VSSPTLLDVRQGGDNRPWSSTGVIERVSSTLVGTTGNSCAILGEDMENGVFSGFSEVVQRFREVVWMIHPITSCILKATSRVGGGTDHMISAGRSEG
jgi:hypothetical protein